MGQSVTRKMVGFADSAAADSHLVIVYTKTLTITRMFNAHDMKRMAYGGFEALVDM